MPDKKQTDRPDNDQPTTPKRPPKAPAQDYSSMPQRPIKLKAGVDVPPALKGSSKKKTASKQKRATPPVNKKKNIKKTETKSEQPLGGLSKQAREVAETAAKREGLSATDWIEKLIVDSTQTTSTVAPSELESIRQALQQINDRLWLLENRKGFWRRFWEQYVEPYQK